MLKGPTLRLQNPRGITQLNDGNLAVCNFNSDSISIINPEEEKLIASLTVHMPVGVTQLDNGALRVDSVSNHVTLIEFEELEEEAELDYTKVRSIEVLEKRLPELGLLAFDDMLKRGKFAGCRVKLVMYDKSHYWKQGIAITDPKTGEIVWKQGIAITDPKTGEIVKELKELKDLTIALTASLTPLNDGNLAVNNPMYNSVSIINPETGEVIATLNVETLALGYVIAIAQLDNGNLALQELAEKRVAIIEFEKVKREKKGGDVLLFSEDPSELNNRYEKARDFFLDNSLLFSEPDTTEVFLYNLFYMPEQLKDTAVKDMGVFLPYLLNEVLKLATPQLIEANREYISRLTPASRQQFFSFFNLTDMPGFTQVAFAELFGRWVRLFERLEAPNMKEAKDAFFQFLRRRGNLFVDKGYNAEDIKDDFLKLCVLYLRGDITDILKEEEAEPIEGRVAASIDRPVTLGMVNMVFGRDPEAVGKVGSLDDYMKILRDVEAKIAAGEIARQDIDDIDKDIDKRISGQDTSENLFIREDVQNARDAILLGGKGGAIKLRSYIPKGSNEWVVSIEDPCGMEFKTAVTALLALDESTKIASAASEGMLGMGFYTNFAGADEVRVTTGVGDGRFYSFTVTRNSEGRLAITNFKELEGGYKGTRVEWVKRFTRPVLPDIDAVFVEYNAYCYIAALQDADIIYKNKKIKEELKLLSSAETPYGALVLYASPSKYQRVTRSLLYVEYPKQEEYFALVPEHYREIIRSGGFTIDLPKGIPLVRTRLTVADKERYMPVIQRAVAALCIKAVIRRYYEDGILPPGLSEDYFRSQLEVKYGTLFDGVQEDAGFINDNSLERVDFGRYLVEPGDSEEMQELKHRSLKYLITLVAIPGKDGKLFTLAGKRQELHEKISEARKRGEAPSMSSVGEGFGFWGYAAKAIEDINNDYSAGRMEDFDRNDPALADFKKLTEIMLGLCGLEDIKVDFYKRPQTRLADFGIDTLRWNLYGAEKYVNKLKEILSRETADPASDYDFFREALYYVAHEGSHFFDIGKASHESAQELVGLFAWRQRELLRRFIRSKATWQDIIARVRRARSGPPAESAQPLLPKPDDQKQIFQSI